MVEKVQMLMHWEEIQGVLQFIDVEEDKGIIILYFSQGIKILVPFTHQLEQVVNEKIGKRISILRTDIEDRPYLIIGCEGETLDVERDKIKRQKNRGRRK